MIYDSHKLVCQCGKCFDAGIDGAVLAVVAAIAEEVDKVVILSGRRCEAHNAAVGGSKTSNHLKGIAVDLTVVNEEKIDHGFHEDFCHDVVGMDAGEYGVEAILYDTFIHLAIREGLPSVFKNFRSKKK